jgi:hypothetical protein
LAQETAGSATVALKDLTITFTSEGGGGGIPEPATLSVTAVGRLALMARRRRAKAPPAAGERAARLIGAGRTAMGGRRVKA